VAALQDKTAEIQSFENLFLDQSDLDVARVSTQLAHLIQALEIVDNRMKIVPGTKALHHLLPDLVVPMDREYTQQFFGWHNPQFQNYPERRFAEAFASFVAVAQITNPVQYLKSGWYSSRTKVIDNAVVGLCCGLKLQWDPTASFGSIDPLNDTPPGCVLPKKSGQELLTRWVQSRQSSRILWHHDLALLAALGHEFCADAVHQLFEAARLIIADGGTLTDVHVHGAARF